MLHDRRNGQEESCPTESDFAFDSALTVEEEASVPILNLPPLRSETLMDSILANGRFDRVLRSSLPKLRTYKLIVTAGDAIVAVVPVTELPIGAKEPHTVVCGSPILSADCSVFTAVSLDRTKYLPKILSTITDHFDRRGVAHVIMKEMAAPDATMVEAGFFRAPIEPLVGIDIRWESFDDYLKSMRKRYRGHYKRALKKLGEGGLRIQEERHVEAIAGELFSLFQNVAFNPIATTFDHLPTKCDRVATWLTNLPRRRQFEMITPAFFITLFEAFDADCDVITIRSGSEIVGCTINLQDNDILHSVYIGLAPGPARPFVYRCLIARKIELAIARRARLLHLGRTCLQTKSELGATELAGGVYCRFRSSVLQTPTAALARMVRRRQTAFVGSRVFKSQDRVGSVREDQ